MWNDRRIDILVVEEEQDKRQRILDALEKSIPGIHTLAVNDGAEARTFLFTNKFGAIHVGELAPKLVLLDLGLPFSDSYSVIGMIHSSDDKRYYAVTPVVVFTNSNNDDRDRDKLHLLQKQLEQGEDIECCDGDYSLSSGQLKMVSGFQNGKGQQWKQ